jgi:hypothetical protein
MILAHLLSLHGEVTADDLKGWKAELISIKAATDFEGTLPSS